MAVKYYTGSPNGVKEMDGLSFAFEAIAPVSGTWIGAYKADKADEIAALDKLVSAGKAKETSEENYNDLIKKKADRMNLSPNMSGGSEAQGAARAEEAPKASPVEVEDDVLEVKQVAKPKRKSKAPSKSKGD
ncbi:MAG: hypothetical protein CMM02_18355 [Rhodopirellula sp.]|nr:hypothetical protein [Rhodopirellula sp.]MAT12962.1 hypothetical protein [Rhodopirellula sp.]|tara:strand:+ start:11641 stop:12036 length:396 start_codon:yes stop_codon:yes gene_type:complete